MATIRPGSLSNVNVDVPVPDLRLFRARERTFLMVTNHVASHLAFGVKVRELGAGAANAHLGSRN